MFELFQAVIVDDHFISPSPVAGIVVAIHPGHNEYEVEAFDADGFSIGIWTVETKNLQSRY